MDGQSAEPTQPGRRQAQAQRPNEGISLPQIDFFCDARTAASDESPELPNLPKIGLNRHIASLKVLDSMCKKYLLESGAFLARPERQPLVPNMLAAAATQVR